MDGDDVETLHSTMFLLIHTSWAESCQFQLPLHSTMFLLILVVVAENYLKNILPLHSTMFLLIQWPSCYYKNSICSLHSTMFLLIRSRVRLPVQPYSALHSTMFLLIPWLTRTMFSICSNFTFHNVSINTRLSLRIQLHGRFLYIPQCFY